MDVIGVIGGMGPQAGIDLARRICVLTSVCGAEEHVPLALLSFPDRIADRTAFLLDGEGENPAFALSILLRHLEDVGAAVVGVACNTAHAPPIFEVLQARLEHSGCRVRLLHMIQETVRRVGQVEPSARRVGVLGTRGTLRLHLYQRALRGAGFIPVVPDVAVQENLIHAAIYDPQWGIKARGYPVTEQARENIRGALRHLKRRGAQVVILGCTELPLAVPEQEVDGVRIVGSTDALARALIRETYPERLRT